MHDPEKLIRRIARVLNQVDPLEALASKLSATDLQSLLLHVFQRRSASRGAAQLLDQFERRPMVQPCTADARALVEIEREAFAGSRASFPTLVSRSTRNASRGATLTAVCVSAFMRARAPASGSTSRMAASPTGRSACFPTPRRGCS